MDPKIEEKIFMRLAETTGVLEAIRDQVKENFSGNKQYNMILFHLNEVIRKNNETLDKYCENYENKNN